MIEGQIELEGVPLCTAGSSEPITLSLGRIGAIRTRDIGSVLLGLFLKAKLNTGLTEKDLIARAQLCTAAVACLDFNGHTVSKNPCPEGAAVVVKTELRSLFV